jgi:hypothetical protein
MMDILRQNFEGIAIKRRAYNVILNRVKVYQTKYEYFVINKQICKDIRSSNSQILEKRYINEANILTVSEFKNKLVKRERLDVGINQKYRLWLLLDQQAMLLKVLH